MQLQVLTTGYWPSPAPTNTLVLPEEVTARIQSFEAFYGNKYQGRRLVWAHALERCVVRYTTCVLLLAHHVSCPLHTWTRRGSVVKVLKMD